MADSSTRSADIQSQVTELQQRLQSNLNQWLPSESDTPERLHQCMRYSAMSPGKAMRPLLMYATAIACDCPIETVDKAAAALECVHVFSLMHDDLPAMDDDDLRRGMATAHVAFDEATAILAGDAILNFAFQLLAEDQPHYPAATQIEVMQKFTHAIGHHGMIAGQMIDIENTNNHVDKIVDIDTLKQMHRLKTGALIALPVEIALMIAQAHHNNLSTKTTQALLQWGQHLGLCYQIVDDVLDIESDTQTLGKPQGADLDANKSTFPAVLGLQQSKKMIEDLQQAASDQLAQLPGDTALLHWIQHFIAHRIK